MRKIISFMHISLDGYVAGPNGEMNWIKVDEELFTYVGERISGGDTALYGRVTYEMMEGYWPGAGDKPGASRHDIEHSRWYSGVQKVVLSRSLRGTARTNTEIIGDNLPEEIRSIKERPGSDILLFGSPTATHALMELGLIDGYWLFVNPILLGRGISLFAGNSGRVPLRLLPGNRRFASGVTELNYEVERQ